MWYIFPKIFILVNLYFNNTFPRSTNILCIDLSICTNIISYLLYQHFQRPFMKLQLKSHKLFFTYDLHLSRLIMEPTTSPTVMAACSSSWRRRCTNHQSTRNKANARILMPAQIPTYLHNTNSKLYTLHNTEFITGLKLNYWLIRCFSPLW